MTKSSEEVLEATVWACITTYNVTTKRPAEFVQMVVAAAKAYAAGDSDALTETRRLLLSEATRPERKSRPALAEGSGQPPASELGPTGSAARPLGGATLSTGPSVPLSDQVLANFHPQPVDNPSHQQAARLLENLHERHTGKTTHR